MTKAEDAFQSFIRESIVDMEQLTSGHIHGSFHVAAAAGDYVLQHLNELVFPDIESVMHNALLLSQHLQLQSDYPYEVPQFIATVDGDPYLRNSHGCWRLLRYIGDPSQPDEVSADLDPHQVARAFGHFSRIASRLDVVQLQITIPGFHDPTRRWSDYLAALSKAIPQRKSQAIEAINRLQHLALIRTWAETKLSDQVAHNDPKPSNIITDCIGLPLAIIDFDTVMPGSYYDDFGDLVRSMCCNHDENTDPRIKQILFDTNIYDQLFQGFTDGHEVQSTAENNHTFQKMAAYIIFEQAARFLGDYLIGDRYYHVDHPEQNHIRALNQITLLESMIEQLQMDI